MNRWRSVLYFQFLAFATVVVAIALPSPFAEARTTTESFNTSQYLESTGGAVWNVGRGELHPPLRITGWDDGGGAQNTLYNVGDGSDGEFRVGRYQLFDTDGDVSSGVIEIDTDVYTNLQFTSFTLSSGYTLRPVGSQPLIIRSQTDVTIDGTIDCSGGDGADGVANINTLRIGGTARCGGGSGGDSVLPGQAPGASNQGEVGGAGVVGGGGGPIYLAGTGGQGGGGGGAYIKTFVALPDKDDPTPGDDSTGGNGGTVGTLVRDDGFTVNIDGAGAGGGGGSAYNDGGDLANNSSGAGGGAGGGNIRIYAVENISVGAAGAVYANGGDGGSVAGGLKGGGGGGGGGGSILMFAGGDITFAGPVTAAAGLGGTTAGGDGGTGAWGRTWIVEKDGFATGVVEDPDTKLNVPGNAEYETGVLYIVTSKAIDIMNTKPYITSLPITIVDQGASSVGYDLAFSDSSNLATLTGFSPSPTYLNLELQRFVRFKIEIINASATTPVRIQSLSFIYDGYEQKEFNFTTGCGRITSGGPPSGPSATILLWLLPVALFLGFRFRVAG